MTRLLLVGLLLLAAVLASTVQASAESLVYLMYPPPDAPGAVATEQPLHRWQQIGTYATLADCQADNLVRSREATARMTGSRGHDDANDAIAAWARTLNSLCVASNDARLVR